MESQIVEYKSVWRDEYLKVVCAFANTNGGDLHIGIDDNGKVIGTDNAKRLLEDIPNKIITTIGIFPEVSLLEEKGLNFLRVKVSRADEPIFYKSKFYIRSGSTTQEIKGNILKRYLIERDELTWDELLERRATLENINMDTVKYFQKLASERMPSIVKEDPVNVLHSLGLFDGVHLTRAAILLFGKNVSKFYSGANLKIGKFVSVSNVVYDNLLEGNLFELLEAGLETLRVKYLKENIHYEGIHRRDVLEYPLDALREALINSLIHKEYPGQTIMIKVFDNALEIWNSGPLPYGVSLDSLNGVHTSVKRNKLCADVFYRAGLIESWGKGTNNIIQACKEAKLLAPVFKQEFDGTSILFRQKENLFEPKITASANAKGLNERQRLLIARFKVGLEEITTRDYIKLVNTSERTARYDLNDLVDKEILKRVGDGSATKYIAVVGE